MNESKPRRLVATLGPRSSDLAAELAASGATGFRLNASHLSPEETGRLARAVRAAAPDRELVIDLQGAKMRLGGFSERRIAPGETLALSLEAREGALPAPHPELFAEARVGETLGVDDGRLRFVVERRADDEIVARCLVGGALRPRKGINLLEHPVRLAGLSPRDRATLPARASRGRSSGARRSTRSRRSRRRWTKSGSAAAISARSSACRNWRGSSTSSTRALCPARR